MKYYKELLTIGIPAYNEAKYIKQTIECCIDQAGCVVVSDNASTDNTQKICEELAQKYSNLVYIRQKENIGGSANFKYVADYAKTKYFMWHGGHDFLDHDYTKNMLHMLENSDAVGCFPASREVDSEGNEIGIYDCWFANRLCCDSAAQRVYALIAHLHNCVALFGIYRVSAIRSVPENYHYIVGGDHVFLCEMAKSGRIIYSARSIYNWRQTKMHFCDEEQIKVWSKSLGNKDNKIESSRRRMIKEQMRILKTTPYRGGVSAFFTKLYLIRKAKKKLRKRFGG